MDRALTYPRTRRSFPPHRRWWRKPTGGAGKEVRAQERVSLTRKRVPWVEAEARSVPAWFMERAARRFSWAVKYKGYVCWEVGVVGLLGGEFGGGGGLGSRGGMW